MITALTVNYNTPKHLERLLSSFRKFYDLPCVVVDGSDEENYEYIKDFDKRFNITMHHFDYNIHHGPGMAFGIKHIDTDRILLIDSDIIFHGGGIIEIMDEQLKEHHYGIGDAQKSIGKGGIIIDYLHPAFALINRKVALRYTLPEKNGAPLLAAMHEMDLKKERDLIVMSKEVHSDFWDRKCKYIQHNDDHEGMGTVRKTGSYNY